MEWFDEAFNILMELEGWDKLTDDSNDPGGLTKFGISKKSYPHLDIENLTLEDAKEIYRRDFWMKASSRIIKQGLGIKLFTVAVLTGVNTAVKLMQDACNQFGHNLTLDGIMGPKTAYCINSFRHPKAIEEMFEANVTFYVRGLEHAKPWLAGWLMRIDKDFGE